MVLECVGDPGHYSAGKRQASPDYTIRRPDETAAGDQAQAENIPTDSAQAA
jgi:hypothetical protein